MLQKYVATSLSAMFYINNNYAAWIEWRIIKYDSFRSSVCKAICNGENGTCCTEDKDRKIV